MKKSNILICLLLISTISFTQKSKEQKIDSLKIVLSHAKEDTVKVKTLNRLSSLNYNKDSELSFKYANSALSLSHKLGFKNGEGSAYNNIALYYWIKSNFPKALDYMYKALKIHENANDKKGIASSYNGLGTVYVNFKNYKLALDCYIKALKISQEIKNQKSIANNLNNIGDVYLSMKEYQKALQYFSKAHKMNIFEKDSFEYGFNYTNMGITYNFLKQYKKSIQATTKSILIYKNDSSLFNGYNKIELGKSHYFLALEEKNKENSRQLLQKSLDYTNEALITFKREESLIDIRDAYLYLSKIKKAQGKHQEALYFFEKSTTLNDSIFSNDNKNQIEILKSQREIDLRDQKIEIQNLKIKNEARKVYLLYTITAIVLILLSFFFWLYLSKRKTNLQLEAKNKIISNINKQKDKFFSIIAHDLRGPFNGFLGLTELLAEDIDDMDKKEIQFAAVNMRNSANNLNRLLENLLEWSRMEQGLIPFLPQETKLLPVVTECVDTLQDTASKKDIKIQTHIPEEINVFADQNILQAMIRNILSNAIKFTPKGGTITIHGKEDDKNTTIAIKDSGIGMNAKIVENLFQLDVKTNRKGTDDEPSTGLGLILCKEFIEKHGGKIWVQSEENMGSTFYFTFPQAIT
jgi:signal transduction histidine kinase/Tfp pilus assembly protein PilF